MLALCARALAEVVPSCCEAHQDETLVRGRAWRVNDRTWRTQPPATAQHVGRRPAAARRVVHLLLGHALVDEARRALWLVLRVVPSARPSEARSGALGAGAGADRAATVGRPLRAAWQGT